MQEQTAAATAQATQPARPQKSPMPPRCRKQYVRFEVVDHGRGIRPQDFERIFQPFVQADEESETFYGGSGLGLAITHKLVKGLGGDINVESSVGKFTKFTVDLPACEEYAVDCQALSKQLQKACAILVGAAETTNARFQTMSSAFGLHLEVVSHVSETHRVLQKQQNSFDHFFLFVHEDQFKAGDWFEENKHELDDATTTLLTFGPRFQHTSAKGHYRSILNIIPQVFVESLLRHLHAEENTIVESGAASTAACNDTDRYAELNILIAEDNKVNQKVLTRLLKKIGVARISVVDNGQRAVDACQRQCFDVVLLDMQMPIMDGLEACRLILQSPVEPKPKIAFVTAQVSQSFIRECIDAGSSSFLAKPFNYQDLEGLLCRLSEASTNR